MNFKSSFIFGCGINFWSFSFIICEFFIVIVGVMMFGFGSSLVFEMILWIVFKKKYRRRSRRRKYYVEWYL